MKNYLDKFDTLDDNKIEFALEDYIILHNQTKNVRPNMLHMKLGIQMIKI